MNGCFNFCLSTPSPFTPATQPMINHAFSTHFKGTYRIHNQMECFLCLKHRDSLDPEKIMTESQFVTSLDNRY